MVQTEEVRPPMRVRTVFVSDVHLGSRHSQADQLLEFLNRYQPDYLYLVGDIIDGWSLKRRWCWADDFSRVVDRLINFARQGTVVRYAAGNHDDFLRDSLIASSLAEISPIEFADEFVHELTSGERFLVIHGDQFDAVESGLKWLAQSGAVLYDMLLLANRLWNRSPFAERRRNSLSARIKRNVKAVVRFISDFETRLTEYARRNDCGGVVCGHIHTPVHTVIDGIEYCNTGDWIENCTALIEYTDGSLELHYFEPGTLAHDCSCRTTPLDCPDARNDISPVDCPAPQIIAS